MVQRVPRPWHGPPPPRDGEPRLLLRTRRYNRVSFGALLSAWGDADLPPLLQWDHLDPLPAATFAGPVLACYSYMMPHEPEVSAEITWLRRQAAGAGVPLTVLAGGAQPTLDPARALLIGADAAFAGEAEPSFRAVISGWLAGQPLAGVIDRRADRHDLGSSSGFHPCIGYLPPVEISRGCPFACAFCSVTHLSAGVVRHRPVERVARIVAEYHARGRSRVKFLTPNAFGYGSSDGRAPNPAAIGELLRAVQATGIAEIHFGSFPGEVRPDFVTPEIIDLVRPFVKNRTMVLGGQSGDDAVLARLNRQHTAADIRRAVRLIRMAGITPHVDFIIGLPWETPADQHRLLDFMESLVESDDIRIHFHTFMPLPRTAMAEARAAPIDPAVRPRIKRLQSAGRLDGWWENQVAYSRDGEAPPPRPVTGHEGSRWSRAGRRRLTLPDGTLT